MRNSNSALDFPGPTNALSPLLVEGISSNAHVVSAGMRGRVQTSIAHYRLQNKKHDPLAGGVSLQLQTIGCSR